MNKSPILIVDYDPVEMILVQEAINALKLDREVCFFTNSQDLMTFLFETKQAPFIIISDVSPETESTFELKRQIATSPALVYKTIPFVYWSSLSIEKLVRHAYDVHSQGFFFKPFALDELCDMLLLIIQYWEKSKHPMPVY